MDKILQLSTDQVEILNGVYSEVFDKSTVRKILEKILSRGKIRMRLISESEGDEEEDYSNLSLDKTILVSLGLTTDAVKVINTANVPDEEDRIETKMFLTSIYEYESWYIGRIIKKINNTICDSAEVVAVRKFSVKELEPTPDNFMDAQMDWVFELLIGDHAELFGDAFADAEEDDEDYDDGD